MKPSPTVLHTRLQYLCKKKRQQKNKHLRKQKSCLLTSMWVKYFLQSEPEVLPILVVSGFCGRAVSRLSEDCKKKIPDEKLFFFFFLGDNIFKYITDIPLQFLVDLITEAYDVLPVLLSVCWMGGFICHTKTFTLI